MTDTDLIKVAAGGDAMTHTPGPWKLLPRDGYTVIVGTNDDGDLNHIASLYNTHPQSGCGETVAPWHKEQSANARLIAAAPDMLAALREQWRVLNADPKPPDAEMVAAARRVEAAIAKAEGRS